VARLRPSIADSTEIAGVITPSPKNSAAPNRPMPTNTMRRRDWPGSPRRLSASSAMMPPSPWLSARMMKAMYFSDTMMVSDQKISDRMPRMLAALRAMPWLGWKHSLSA
jgi:hypothetical protein